MKGKNGKKRTEYDVTVDDVTVDDATVDDVKVDATVEMWRS